MEKNKDGISILICSYNTTLHDILLTTISTITQKNALFEIIYCDDASQIYYKEEIIKFLEEKKFNDYVFSINAKNQGTVNNIINGLEKSKYKYCKTIGAGDLFYDTKALNRILDYFHKYDCDYIIGRTCYFSKSGEGTTIYNRSNPCDIKCYLKDSYNQNKIKRRLLLNGDNVGGVSTFIKTDVLMDVLLRFKNKIIYAEDMTILYSAFTNRIIHYFNIPTLYYEYGVGVSRPSNSPFAIALKKDVDTAIESIKQMTFDKKTNKIIIKRKILDSVKNEKLRKLLRFIIVPSQIIFHYRYNHQKKYQYDLSFLDECENQINSIV